MRRRRAEGAAAAELHVKGVVAATEVTSQPDDASLLTFAVELSYKGECEGGAPNGVGTISSVLGVYEGEVRRTRSHNHTHIAAHTRTHVQVVNGVPHGLGVFTSSLVGRYEGEWVSGQRCGHGQFVQSDQSVYRGEWVAGMKHGSGCEVDGEGVMVRGTWTSGVLTVRESSAGDSLEVQQRLALAQVRSYEQCLKPMPRFGEPARA